MPELTWTETPGGVAYLAARRVEDNVWVRSAEILGANLHTISSIFETGQQLKRASPPFLSLWTLPVDDDKSVTFGLSHVADDEPMSFEKRRALEVLGQSEDRPYRERQWIPGDHDAQVGQGPINIHALEHLGSNDRGIAMFRRQVRRGIEAVERGEDPRGFYLNHGEVPPTFANDRVVRAAEIEGGADDPGALRRFAERVAKDYGESPPVAELA